MSSESDNITPTDKVGYVKSQPQTRQHGCHWPGCPKQCPPAMWGCKQHWFSLPKNLRDQIWVTYEPGQEVALTPSEEYLVVAQRVQDWILENACVMSQDHHVMPHRHCVLR